MAKGERRERDGGVIDDLEDQAAWSSYGSHIPRAGDAHRQRIWSNRFYRSWKRFPFLAFGLYLAGFLAIVLMLAPIFGLFAD